MPANGGRQLDHFYRDGHYKNNRSYLNSWCNHCVKFRVDEAIGKEIVEQDQGIRTALSSKSELEVAARSQMTPICSKPKLLIKHLVECEHVSEDIKATFAKSNGDNAGEEDDDQNGHIAKKRKVQTNSQVVTKRKWTSEEKKPFQEDLCALFVANNYSFNSIANEQWRKFASKWMDDAPLPSRQFLSGNILKNMASKVDQEMKDAVKGKMGMGQCDGWKNVARDAIVASMVTVEDVSYIVHTHDVTAERKTANNLLLLVLSAIQYLHSIDVTIVGWVSDAGGDSRAMRLRLAALMPQLVVLDCWAHQVNLIVGDYLKAQNEYVNTVEEASKVIKWFNDHTYPLGLLRKEQKSLGMKVLSLIHACHRWASQYTSCNRLLILREPMQRLALTYKDELLSAAGKKPEQREAAQSILRITTTALFWSRLEEVCSHLRPLARAVNMAQGPRGSLSYVALTIANLYRVYLQDDSINDKVQRCLLDSISRRWAKTDQDSFILAVILNPYIRTSLFKPESGYCTIDNVQSLMERMYIRFFSEAPDSEFVRSVGQYYRHEGLWSPESMLLHIYAKESNSPNLYKIWSNFNNDTGKGDNQLVQLAMRIHSVVANSASCERLFSRMGLIHTKQRNRLKLERVRDMASIGMHLKREEQPKSNPRKRKRSKTPTIESSSVFIQPEKSGIDVPTAAPSPEGAEEIEDDEEDEDIEDAEGAENNKDAEDAEDFEEADDAEDTKDVDVRQIAEELAAAAGNDDDADDDESLDHNPLGSEILAKLGVTHTAETPPQSPGQDRFYFGTKEVVGLAELWDFGGSEREMWEMWWDEGEKGSSR